MTENEIHLKKGDTSDYHASVLLRFVENGDVTLDGEALIVEDGKDIYKGTLTPDKLTMFVEAGWKGNLMRGKAKLG